LEEGQLALRATCQGMRLYGSEDATCATPSGRTPSVPLAALARGADSDRMANQQSSADSPLAAAVALLVLPIAIYFAFWQIDWSDTNTFSLWSDVLLPVAFCIAAPSIIGSIVAAIARRGR
jgi:hypothetical protein